MGTFSARADRREEGSVIPDVVLLTSDIALSSLLIYQFDELMPS
jgi:hypothetical protein